MTTNMTEVLQQLWENEYEQTLRVIAAIPADQMGFVPFPGAMPLRRLALHVVGLEDQFIRGVAAGELVAGGSQKDRPEVQTPADLAEVYRTQHAALRPVLAALTAERLAQPVPFRLPNGTQVRQAPGLQFLFTNMLHHMIHHRAQLLVYLRLLGQPIPGLYGPTREEMPPMR